MKNLKRFFLLIVISSFLTFSIANATEFEVGGQIFYVPIPQVDNFILFGGNVGVEVAPSFILRGFGGVGSKTIFIPDVYGNTHPLPASITLLGGGILYRIGEGNIKPYAGAGFSQLSLSVMGFSVSVSYINLLGGISLPATEKLEVFAEVRYMLPLQSGEEGILALSGGLNYRF